MTTTPRARSSSILIRVTRDERDRLSAEARRRGLALGAWLRSLGLAAIDDDPAYTQAMGEADAAAGNGEAAEVVAGMRRRASARRDERFERRRITRD